MNTNSFPFREDRLKALSIEQGQVDYSDSSLSGFLIRVTKNKKVFYVRRKREGKFIRVRIGDYPTINYKQARALAFKTLRDIEKGINPNEQRKEHDNKAITLEAVFESYLSNRPKGKELRPKTIVGYKQVINCYLADWKDKPIIQLTEDEIAHIHKQVTSRSQAQADLMARVLRALFNYAKYQFRGTENAFIFAENPVRILSHRKLWNKVGRKNTRIRPTELKQYLSAIDIVRNNPEYDRFTRSVCDAVEFALFTGLRKEEVLELEWERVNLKDSYFWIDVTKNGDPLELPITETLRSILIRRWSERDQSARYVFASNDIGQTIREPKYVLRKINESTIQEQGQKGLVINWHDLRRTYGTSAESTGVGKYTIKRLLNHRISLSNDVTAGYIVLSADELREPAIKIEQLMLKNAGLIKKKQGIDATLSNLLSKASEEEKRALIFQLSQSMEQAK